MSRALLKKSTGNNIIIKRWKYFPESFKEPILNPTKLKELEDCGEIKELKYDKFLPAKISSNSSVFYDSAFERFVNYIMTGGNKQTARGLMEMTFYEIKKTQILKYHSQKEAGESDYVECNPYVILHQAIKNCQPLLEVSPVKRGAVVYQVPVPITSKKSEYLSYKWILEASRDKGTRTPLSEKMAKELIDAFNYEGRVIKKKQDLHKLCEANRAYAHFRWT